MTPEQREELIRLVGEELEAERKFLRLAAAQDSVAARIAYHEAVIAYKAAMRKVADYKKYLERED